MKFPNWIYCTGLLCGIGCSAAPTGDGFPSSTGGTTASGGAATGGVIGAGTGGSATTTGGMPSTGGSFATTGGSNTGGSSATGGSSNTGGSTGGASSGGSSSGGSNSSGGSAGGNSAGRNAGGTSSTGGKGFGGKAGGTGGASGGSGGTSTGGTGGGTTSTDPIQLYGAVCASCHGPRGEGVSGKGPDIQHPVRDFATWVVRNGRSGNPGFPGQTMAAYPQATLPDATLTGLFDWLSTPALPKPTTGQALYKDFCANCHSATGTGGTAAHNAKGQTLTKALQMVRSGHSLTQFSSRTGYMSKWTTSELTDAEVGLIVTYLDSL
jgi:mono/diheme cytochrome c family protein